MGNKPARRYGVYDVVRKALAKDGIKKSGATATFLLDAFIIHRGIIAAADVSKAELLTKSTCPEEEDETFKQWRKTLIDKKWLAYDEDYARRTKRFKEHQQGSKLIAYINRETLKHKEIATMDDIRDLREEKADKSEVQQLKVLVHMILEKLDPPGDDAKCEEYAKNPEKMLRLIANDSSPQR